MAYATPNTTKTGKPRIFGMTVPQLQTLLENTSKDKEKAKIRNRIRVLEAQKNV